MNYNILHQLIDKVQEYENETGQKLEKEDLVDFSEWLYEKTRNVQTHSRVSKKEIKPAPNGETLDSIIGKFIGYMYRFTKFYVKKP